MIALYALTLAAFPIALGLAAWHGARDTWRPAKPGETPGQLTPQVRRAEWAADFAHLRATEAWMNQRRAVHASADTADTPQAYRGRHALVRAHLAATIGRPPAELVMA